MKRGDQVGPYRIDSEPLAGGMAEVYKAYHCGLNVYHALKVPMPNLVGAPDFLRRFMEEASKTASLQHPNIVTIHDVSGAGAPEPYFAMEWIEGGDLAALLHQRGHLTPYEAASILRQVAAALDYAHSRGIVHRDIKPGNVFLQPDGRGGMHVKVGDFGIARAQEGTGGTKLTATGMILGTPEYMSPEQCGNGNAVDYRTDQYSLGVVAYEMLCGRPPFPLAPGGNPVSVIVHHVHDAPSPPAQIMAGLPPAVNNAILKALEKQPQDRFRSCLEFVDSLSGAGAPASQPVRTVVTQLSTDPAPTAASSKGAPPWAYILLGAGVAIVAFALFQSRQQGKGNPPPPDQPLQTSMVTVPLLNSVDSTSAETRRAPPTPAAQIPTPVPHPMAKSFPDVAMPGEIFPQTRLHELTSAEIAGFANSFGGNERNAVQYALNEILARHGCEFTGNGMHEFYKGHPSWYTDRHISQSQAQGELKGVELDNFNALATVRDHLEGGAAGGGDGGF